MEIKIYHTQVPFPNGKRGVGIEVQPPLDEQSSRSVITELSRGPYAWDANQSIFATSATITRNDEAGTAFAILPDYRRDASPKKVARVIGRLIDPCNLHDIAYISSEAREA